MVRFERCTSLPVDCATAFDLSLSIDAHLGSVQRSGERAVGGVTSGVIGLGEFVTWRARHFVEIAGPWKGAVEVIHLDDRCVRMATLDGHMDAGVIEFGFAQDGPVRVGLTIDSLARSRDSALDLLYDKVGVRPGRSSARCW